MIFLSLFSIRPDLLIRLLQDEIALIEKYKIFEYLNAFAGSLAHATGGPVSPWTPITDAGIIEDAELEGKSPC